MATLFTAYANKIADFLIRGVPLTPPATIYVAEASTASTASAHGTELVFSGYARQAVPGDTADWTAASAGSVGNVNPIVVTSNAPSSFSIDGYWLTDAPSGVGNDMLFCNFGSPVAVAVANVVQFNAGGLTVAAS